MAIQTRYTGDAQGIVNVDLGVGTVGNIVATGLTKNPVALKVAATNLGVVGEMVTGGAVETILRAIAVDSTIVMYQVDVGQISVLLEASGAGGATGATQYGAASYSATGIASALQTRIQALNAGGNIGVAGNVWAAATTVSTTNFKLA
ncbi:MAG TPA: hypothetical protein VFM18_17250 [Methanosarcina sp.]|nr:hypothetical protein [Methanosarcina sp.]